jgi:hypothetical protein
MLHNALRLFCLFSLMLGTAFAGQIQLMPAGPMVADGESPVTLHIWIPHLVSTDKVKVKPAHGKVQEVVQHPGGMLAVSWIPAREGTDRDVDVTVTIRHRGADPEEATLIAPLTAPLTGQITVDTTPGEWAPDREAIQVKFTLSGTSKQTVGDRRLLVAASAGSITEAVPLGDGTFSARWTPPTGVQPAQTVVISAVDAAAPSTVFGWTSFPMLANQSLSFGATPDSQNVLVIGTREYGPEQASPAGTVAFDALVNPTVRKGLLRSTLRDGRTLDVPAPLPLAEFPRISFMAQPPSIPAGKSHTLLMVATTTDGSPLDTATVTVRSNASTLGTATKTTTPGVYSLRVQPDEATSIPLEVSMKEPTVLISKFQKASTQLNVIGALPKAYIGGDPSPFPEDAKTVVFTAKVENSKGMAVTDSLPGFTITDSQTLGRPANQGDGRYQLKVRPMGETMFAVAVPRFEGSASTPASVLVWPAEPAVDINVGIPVMVAALDAFGHPIANTEFVLSAPGAGTFPTGVKSGNNGIAVTTYTATANPGLVTIVATAAGLKGTTGIFQGDASAGPGPVLSGDSATVENRSAVTAVVGTARIDKAIPAPVVAAAPAPIAKAPVVEATPAPTAAPAVPSAPAVPAATAAVPAATAAKPTPQPRPKPAANTGSAFGGSTSSVYLALLGSHHSFSQEADVPEGTPSRLPPVAEFSRTMAPGVKFGGDYWVKDGNLGISMETRLTSEAIKALGRVNSFTSWSIAVGAKYKLGDLDFGTPYALGMLQRAQTTLFKYAIKTGEDGEEVLDSGTMEADQKGLFGVRLGGGLVMDLPSDLKLDVQISELLNPNPVATHLGATVFKPVANDLNLLGGLDLDFKHVGMTSSGMEVKVSEFELGLVAGVQYTGL